MGTAENDSTRAQACKQNHETNVTKTVAVDIMLLPPSNKMWTQCNVKAIPLSS